MSVYQEPFTQHGMDERDTWVFCSFLSCPRNISSICSPIPTFKMKQEGMIFLHYMYEIGEIAPLFQGSDKYEVQMLF